MYCSNCGSALALGSKFCPNCGQPQAMAPSAVQPATAGTSGPKTSIDFRRLGIGDLISLIATVILFVSLFLPWYSFSESSTTNIGTAGPTSSTLYTISALGTMAGGWRFLILVLAIVIILLLLVLTLLPRGLRAPIPYWQLLTVLCSVSFLLVLLAFLVRPSGAGTSNGFSYSWSWSYGAFLGLSVGLAAIVGGVVRRSEPEVIVPGAPRSRASVGITTAYLPPVKPVAPISDDQQLSAADAAHCTNCGASLGDTKFCTSCGQPIAP